MKSLLTCQGNLFSCRSLPDHIARGTENRVLGLKEWAVNVKALKEGDQTVLAAFNTQFVEKTLVFSQSAPHW